MGAVATLGSYDKHSGPITLQDLILGKLQRVYADNFFGPLKKKRFIVA